MRATLHIWDRAAFLDEFEGAWRALGGRGERRVESSGVYYDVAGWSSADDAVARALFDRYGDDKLVNIWIERRFDPDEIERCELYELQLGAPGWTRPGAFVDFPFAHCSCGLYPHRTTPRPGLRLQGVQFRGWDLFGSHAGVVASARLVDALSKLRGFAAERIETSRTAGECYLLGSTESLGRPLGRISSEPCALCGMRKSGARTSLYGGLVHWPRRAWSGADIVASERAQPLHLGRAAWALISDPKWKVYGLKRDGVLFVDGDPIPYGPQVTSPWPRPEVRAKRASRPANRATADTSDPSAKAPATRTARKSRDPDRSR